MARRAVGAWCLGRHGKRPERRVLRAGQWIVLPQIVRRSDTAILTRQHRIPSDLRS